MTNPNLTWRQRKGWLLWAGRRKWAYRLDRHHPALDSYGRQIWVCTRCGTSFVYARCPSFTCSPENLLPVADAARKIPPGTPQDSDATGDRNDQH
jgi:hypothetical protein